ncbi:hypothetical protein [Paraburkholderia sp. DHOC27]|uniref:hypothetical protein n=1 Tax=Paraburkholderia sp. DHOC27 TaxID=2303330 RepID=UPI000E3B841A|nr:hypothetical protein [Paraburkholderia sp. DHOC27]RFU46145.1 hypothetical protein D0B32_21090 [Paraburkholderia sp. DHOC27]
MARPKIGIFGALAILGGVLAWRWTQRQRASQAFLNRELNRWEDEGGSVVTPAQAAASAGGAITQAEAPRTGQTNGAAHPNGMGEAWPFPHS